MHVVIIFLFNLNMFHKRQTVGCPKKFEENVVGENDADEITLSVTFCGIFCPKKKKGSKSLFTLSHNTFQPSISLGSLFCPRQEGITKRHKLVCLVSGNSI